MAAVVKNQQEYICTLYVNWETTMDIPLDESPTERRNRLVGKAVGLNADQVEQWVTSIEEDGSGMGYVVQFSRQTPADLLAKVEGLGSDLSINIGPID
ncbi:hypothetical protein D3C76_276840 [compost metagenome]